MKNLLITLSIFTSLLATSAVSFANEFNCSTELQKNTAIMQEISVMDNISEGDRSVLFEVASNTRISVELACGMAEVSAVDPVLKLAIERQKIMEIEGISEGDRSVLLAMNTNSFRSLELME